MLRIIQKSSAASVKSYYSSADYFTEGQELEGVWRGKAAAELGLSGKIEQKDWEALCDNLDPSTGKQLTVRRKQDRRVGWDFNFSVPKSISLLYAIGKDQRIVDTFEEAVDQTMADIERDLQTRVRRSGQNSDRTTGNGAWGRFVHFTSRPVDGVPDPQLHAHCVLFNITKDPNEDRWKAAQIGSIKRDANYYSALMHSRLASRLVELGIPVERTAKSWRIVGIDAATENKFSRRTQQIEQLAQERGITDPDEKAALGAMTRERKNKQLSMEELRAVWQSWLTPEESDAIRRIEQNAIGPQSPSFRPENARTALHHAAEHHFERESVIPERKLLTTTLHHAIGKATVDQVHEQYRQSELIVGEQGGRRMVTAPNVLEEERQMIAFARNGRDGAEPLAASDAPLSREWLNADQRKALAHLCNSRDRVTVLRGVAGTGKTSMLKEAVERIERNGKQVLVFAPSAEASRDVLVKEGFANAQTVAHLLMSKDAQAAVRDNVILIDEAGLLGTRTMAQVFDLAKRENARVILSGDRFQHRAVERGSALRLLEQEAGIRSAELIEIIRQKDRYRQAVAYLSQGRVEAGFKALDELKWIHEIADPQQRYERIAAEYLQATEAGKSVIVVSPTHAEGRRVTTAIRFTLQREGKIGADQQNVLKLTSRKLTVAQRRDKVNFIDGDIVIFTQNAPGYRKGTRLTVGVDDLPLDHAARFEVYQPETLPVAKGDLIRITAGGKSADGHRVDNGQQYRIQSIAEDGTLTLNNGWHLGPAFGQIDYAYCSTSHAAQGKTRDQVIVAESSDSFAAAGKEQLYVSVSRARQSCSIYTDDKEALLDAVSSGDERGSATELVTQAKQHTPRHRAMPSAALNAPSPVLQQEAHVYDR